MDVAETADANKNKLDREAALKLARQVDFVVATKGKKRTEIDMRKNPSDDEVLPLLLGPTGNIRAPLIRVGKTLVAGFDPDVYGGALEAAQPGRPAKKK